MTWQLRGEAGKRQVEGAKIGLQHNIGLGGSVVVALYRLGFVTDIKPKSEDTNKPIFSPKTASKNQISDNGDGFLVSPYLRVLEIAMQEDKDNLIEKVRGESQVLDFTVNFILFMFPIICPHPRNIYERIFGSSTPEHASKVEFRDAFYLRCNLFTIIISKIQV